jgi:hypothetical protein
MGYFLNLIGYIVCAVAVLYMNGAESSMHQIFAQLQFVTSAILIGSGSIINSIDGLKEKYEELADKLNTKP